MDNLRNFCWYFTNNDWKQCEIIKDISDCFIININGQEKNVLKEEVCPKNNDINDLPNLTDLIHLNEPSILHSSQIRYEQNKIYTFTGNILLAINPFQKLSIYNNDSINYFKNNKSNNLLSKPHPYLISKLSLEKLFETKKNQVILVSGESGAGKTQTTKFIMKYISNVSEKKVEKIEEKILASNPILEAFGNAKTIRNDNSSRFGKFIKLCFKDKILVGAKIESYLLEKIRLTSLNKNERNFHIFYQLLKHHPTFKSNIIDYNYLNKSTVTEREDNVTDEETYNELLDSFNKLGFSDELQENIFELTYFILKLGNINKIEDLVELKNYFNFNLEILENLFKYKIIFVNNEEIKTENTETDFVNIRDTIAQTLYQLLFNFIVSFINNNIEAEYNNYIGLLDIFGFEIFKNNGFEQLCINYTNEKLQNIFNKYIFELEQEEYKKEEIPWENINFPNNKKIISLIESKKQSVFSYQIEQSILKNGTNKAFYQSMINNLLSNQYFTVDKKDKVSRKFNIEHYAGIVKYNSKRYIEKNKNTYDFRLNQFIKSSDNNFIDNLNLSVLNFANNKIKSKNIITQFRQQLNLLLDEISKNNQFYIRCIKPNDLNKPNNFNRIRVLNQFRYCGVLEAIKIARLGYPIRILFQDFINLFYSLLINYKVELNLNNIFDIFNKLQIEDKNYKIGKTKLFLKKDLYNNLYKKNNEIRRKCILQIQKNNRKYIIRKRFINLKNFIIKVQYFIRKLKKKRLDSSIKINSKIRQFLERKKYLSIFRTLVKLQKFIKKYQNNKRLDNLNKINNILNKNLQQNGFNKLKDIIYKEKCCDKIIKFYKIYKRKQKVRDKFELISTIKNIEEINNNLDNKVVELNKDNNDLKKQIEEMNKQLTEYKKINESIIETNLNEKIKEKEELKNSQIEKLEEENNNKEIKIDKLESDNNNKELIIKKLEDENKNNKKQNLLLRAEIENKNNEIEMKDDIIRNMQEKINEMSEKFVSINNNYELLEEQNVKLLKRLSDNVITIENFKEDQIILGNKMRLLYLKLDEYEEKIKKKRKFLF